MPKYPTKSRDRRVVVDDMPHAHSFQTKNSPRAAYQMSRLRGSLRIASALEMPRVDGTSEKAEMHAVMHRVIGTYPKQPAAHSISTSPTKVVHLSLFHNPRIWYIH